jgi:hypothetical protein
MPNMNGYYPLSNIQRTDAAYDPKLSFAHPSELLGSGDTNIDPFTGEEKFDVGGAVKPAFDSGKVGAIDIRNGYANPFDNPDFTGDSYKEKGKIYFRDGAVTADDSWMGRGSSPPPPEEIDRRNLTDIGFDPYGTGNYYNSNTGTDRGRRVGFGGGNEDRLREDALGGGIGSYVDNLNKEFAAGPRYKTNPGVDWTTPGGTYVGGTGGGGGGGDGDGIGGIDKWGPGALVIGGKIYKNWDEIKAAWDKITDKNNKELADQTTKDATANYVNTELADLVTKIGDPAKKTAITAEELDKPLQDRHPLDKDFTTAANRVLPTLDDIKKDSKASVEVQENYSSDNPFVPDSVVAPAVNAAVDAVGPEGDVSVDSTYTSPEPSGIASVVAPAVNAAIESAGPTSSVTVDDPANLEGYGSEISNASPGTGGIASLGGSAAGALANTVGSRTGQILVGDAAEAAGDIAGSLGGEAAKETAGAAAGEAGSSASKGILSGAGKAISDLKSIVGGDSAAGRLMVGDTGKITNLANLPGNLASAGLSYLGSKLADSKASKIGSSLGSMVLGPVGSIAGSILGEMFGGFTGIGATPHTIANPFTGEMIHAYSDEGKALRAAQDSDSYKASDLPSGPYGSLGMSPEAGYYAKQTQMRDLANQMSAAGYSGYDKYKNVNVNDMPFSNGSTWTPETSNAGPEYSGGNIADFTPDQLEAVKKFAPEYYRSLTSPTARSANTDAELQRSLEAQLATEGRREAPIDPYAGEEEFDDLPPARRGKAAGGLASLPEYKAGGLLHGPGDGVSDSIPAVIKGATPQRAALADGEFVIPARIVSELGNGSTKAGSARLYEMMDRVQKRRGATVGKNKTAVNSKAYEELHKL